MKQLCDFFVPGKSSFVETYKKASDKDKTALLAEGLKKDPDGLFAELRKEQPILKTPTGFIVTLFDDVQEALTRNDVFTVRPYQPKMDPSVGPFMLARDNTEYNYRDKSMMQVVLRLNDLPAIRQLTAKLTSQALQASKGKVEIVSALSRRIPIKITGEYFGFPGPDEASMFRWSYWTQYDMFHNLTNDPKVHEENIRSGKEMRAYLEKLVPERRAALASNPNLDDSLSRLLKITPPDATDFNDERIISNIMGLLVGGVETTSQAIVQVLDQLIRVFPDKLEEAKKAAQQGNDATFDAYVWEALRFNPINPFVARLAVQDYKLAAGTKRETFIPKGSVMLISGRSAMQDEQQIPDAAKFRTDRPAYHYMHFGFGAHECLGKYVGLMEIPEIIKQVVLQKNLRVAEPIDFAGGPFPEKYTLAFDA